MSDILADDMLRGASAIAEYMFGTPSERRRVYRLASEVAPEHRIPTFRLGEVLCARRSTLTRWIEQQEAPDASSP